MKHYAHFIATTMILMLCAETLPAQPNPQNNYFYLLDSMSILFKHGLIDSYQFKRYETIYTNAYLTEQAIGKITWDSLNVQNEHGKVSKSYLDSFFNNGMRAASKDMEYRNERHTIMENRFKK